MNGSVASIPWMPSTPVSVLLIDDEPDWQIVMDEALHAAAGDRYALSWVGSYAEGLAAAERRQFDAYLVDYRLGAGDGLELIQNAVRSGVTAPIVVLTGHGVSQIEDA